MSVKISAFPELTEQLQSADFVPVVRNGVNYKHAPFNYLVKNSGNETIAGVKTFSSSPVVPTPTTDMQASTKKYVDDSIDALGVGDPNGVATLDSDGKVPAAQMPPIAISNITVVASEAAMLALTAETGDLAKRTDYTPAKTFILAAEPASTLSNWVEITVSTDPNTPTSDQKAALVGNSGTPSSTNPYATDASLVPLEALKEYDPTYPYDTNEVCFYLGVSYKSLSTGNSGHTPMTPSSYWEVNSINYSEVINIAHPIDDVIFQGPNDADPATLYPGTTWDDVSWEEANMTRRTAGDLAGARFTGVPAHLAVSVTGGVPTVSIINGGSGYLSGGSGTITLTLVGTCSTQATRTATVTNGVITAINTLVAGAGYTSGKVAVYDGVAGHGDLTQGHKHTFITYASGTSSGLYVNNVGGSNASTFDGVSAPQNNGNGDIRNGAETSTAWVVAIKWRRTA